jgi:hypothetical protein
MKAFEVDVISLDRHYVREPSKAVEQLKKQDVALASAT